MRAYFPSFLLHSMTMTTKDGPSTVINSIKNEEIIDFPVGRLLGEGANATSRIEFAALQKRPSYRVILNNLLDTSAENRKPGNRHDNLRLDESSTSEMDESGQQPPPLSSHPASVITSHGISAAAGLPTPATPSDTIQMLQAASANQLLQSSLFQPIHSPSNVIVSSPFSNGVPSPFTSNGNSSAFSQAGAGRSSRSKRKYEPEEASYSDQEDCDLLLKSSESGFNFEQDLDSADSKQPLPHKRQQRAAALAATWQWYNENHRLPSVAELCDIGFDKHNARLALRLMKNREAARECRRKKKEYVKCLEERVEKLEKQNETLGAELKRCKSILEKHDL